MSDSISEVAKPGRKAKKLLKQGNSASSLLAALNFIALAQHKEGDSYKLHCKLANKFATSFDGVLACGHIIEDDLDAQPNTAILIKALSKCGDSLSITHVDNQLAIVSNKFKVFVPCDPTPLIAVKPDPLCAHIDGRLSAALAIVADLPEEGEERLVCRSVLIQAGSVVGCRRGHVIIEAWHGIELPPGLCVPVRSIKAVLNSKKELKQFGFSDRSVTFYFEDGSWIRSQLDEGKYPDYQRMFSLHPSYDNIPEGFFDAVKDASSFSNDGRIRIRPGTVSSHSIQETGCSIECDGLTGNVTFLAEYLERLRTLARQADFYHDRGCFFVGEKDGINARGAIARMA